MPVEIREISIGAKIADRAPPRPQPAVDAKKLREEILAECAELIKRALERQWER